jgi:hypothetical protein
MELKYLGKKILLFAFAKKVLKGINQVLNLKQLDAL